MLCCSATADFFSTSAKAKIVAKPLEVAFDMSATYTSQSQIPIEFLLITNTASALTRVFVLLKFFFALD